MSKKPSPETQLRTATREIHHLISRVAACSTERAAYRVRATQAEQEATEWKRRFDQLLARMPKEQT